MVHSPGFLNLVNEAKKKIKQSQFTEIKKRLDAGEKLILVDTREDLEWANGHLPGAIHLGKGVIERDIEQNDSRSRRAHRPLLRRRIPLRPRCR